MSIDTGFNIKYNPALPIPGVKQSSQGIRDNFAVIKRAIEALQNIETSPTSIFAVETEQDTDGSISLGISFANNAFRLPIGSPTVPAAEGMIRYHNGVLQIHNGTAWSLVSGATVEDIIEALELDPTAWTPTPDRHGEMTDPSLHALAVANGAAGFMSGGDKAKLDNLTVSFNSIEVSSDEGTTNIQSEVGSSAFKLRALSPLTVQVVGKEIRLGANLPTGGNASTSGAGLMSSADKIKLDSLVTNLASNSAKGYMSANDKAKLDNISKAFSRINVNNGPILPSDDGSFEITGSGGVFVTAIPGQQKISISLNNIGGYSPTALANTVTAFNSQRSRNATEVAATSNEQLSHTKNQNATVDVLFSWNFSGSSADIDGFRITVNSSLSSSAYTFGSSLVSERIYDIPADRRSFTLTGATPNHYYTFFVQAFRLVTSDIDSSGVLLGPPRKCTITGKNPYRPEVTPEFSGSLSGSLNGISIDQLITNINNAANNAVWANITGPGKPQNNADVTSQNTALNTLNVGNKSASQVLTEISGLTTNLQSLTQLVNDIQTGGPIAGEALQSYVTAAQLAKTQAEGFAAQVQTQFTSIAQTRIVVEQDRDTALAARQAAETALDGVLLNSTAVSEMADDASQAAQAAAGSAQTAQAQADSASASAVSAESSNLSAALTVTQIRPFDFARDALFWVGFTSNAQGVTFQNTEVGRTYRQLSDQAGWIAPKKSFISTAFRRIRAKVRCRYLTDGLDPNGQSVSLIVKGIDDNGVYHDTILGNLYSVNDYTSSGQLSSSMGWHEYAVDFVVNSEFIDAYKQFNLAFSWNRGVGRGTVEIVTFIVEDVTESTNAAISAQAAVTASSAAVTARNESEQFAQASSQNAINAATSASQANTYRLDAAEAAETAETARASAAQQASISTNAAVDAQVYSSSAASHAMSASSDATRAENSAESVIESAATAQTASIDAINAANAASGHANTATVKANEAGSSASSAALSAVAAQTSSESAMSSASAASVSADTAVTRSTEAEQSAVAAQQSENLAQSHLAGATNAAEAATLAASSARTNATLTTQYADAAERSSLAARITFAALLPWNFSEGVRFWSPGSTGTMEARLALPPTGTIVSDNTFGKIFQSPLQAGSIAPVGAQAISPNRIYRVTAIVRAITNNTGPSSVLTFYAAGLNTALTSEVNQITIGTANPLTYSAGWQTYTKDIPSNDFGLATHFRPVLRYNQTNGNQTIQIREIRIEDVTESKNATSAASATIDTMRTTLAYKNQTVQYAQAVEVQLAQAQTAAGTASVSATQAAQSVADALGYRNSAAASQLAAANSASLAGQEASAAAGSAQTAETYATEASISAQSALTAAINASTSTGSLLPAGFGTDGAEWIIQNGTATYQDVAGFGRTARITGAANGTSRIMPFSYLLPEDSKRYRVTVKARYYSDGTNVADQLCKFDFEGFTPSSSVPCEFEENEFGVIEDTISAADSWTTFSADFTRISTSLQLRVKFLFNAGVSGNGNGVVEILSFRIEDITEAWRAKGFADAAFVSSSEAAAYQDAAGSSATSASNSANTASITSQGVRRLASQLMPGDFSLDSIYFTNALTGENPGDITVGSFITIT